MPITIQQQLTELQTALETYKSYVRFFGSQSHEIRTPLSVVIGIPSLLQESALTDEQRKHLDRLINAGNHLFSVINTLFDIGALVSGSRRYDDEVCTLRDVEQFVAWIHARWSTVQLMLTVAEDIEEISLNADNLYKLLQYIFEYAVSQTSEVRAEIHVSPSAICLLINAQHIRQHAVSEWQQRELTAIQTFLSDVNHPPRPEREVPLPIVVSRLLCDHLYGAMSLEMIDEQTLVMRVNLPLKEERSYG